MTHRHRTPSATARRPPAAPPRTHPLRTRHHIVAPSLRIPDAAAASVFAAVRQRGPIARDVIAQRHRAVASPRSTGRSPPCWTPECCVNAPTSRSSGAIGRPRVPVEVNHEPFLTLGMHIGARTTSIVATDLFGRTLDVVETPTPRGAQTAALAALADSARRYLSRWHRRRPLWVGRRHRWRGRQRHRATSTTRGWAGRRLRSAPVLGRGARAAGVGGLARRRDGRRRTAARDAPARRADRASSLYVYARETVGFALVIGGRVHSPASGPGHHRRAAGAFRAARRHRAAGVHGQRRGGAGGGPQVRRILPAAGPTSTIAALCRGSPGRANGARSPPANCWPNGPGCWARPSRCCATCSTPTTWWSVARRSPSTPRACRCVEAAFAERSVLAPRDIRVTAFGNRVQEAGAGVVSLGGLYADPIGAMRRVASTAGPEVSCLTGDRRHGGVKMDACGIPGT